MNEQQKCKYYSFGHFCNLDLDEEDPERQAECDRCKEKIDMQDSGMTKYDYWGEE
jgi:hypothetical protein